MNIPPFRRSTFHNPCILGVALFGIFACAFTGKAQDATVSTDGGGTFTSVQAALNAAPPADSGKRLFLISIRPGIYREKLSIPKGRSPIKLIGSDPAKTTLTYNDSAGSVDANGKKLGTFDSASISVLSDDFTAENLTFENSFGQGSQAVALQFAADRGTFRNCHFLGWQDTLLLKSGSAYFENCLIQGSVDFIFGAGSAWFERCELRCLAPGFITAASTPEDRPFGFVFSQCKITATGNDWPTYLGRPWRPHGSVTFLHTEMIANLRPAGWHNWDNPTNEKTARFGELNSRGQGAASKDRVPWSKQLAQVEASAITIPAVLSGWNPHTVLSGERIASLPEAERARWEDYIERSNRHLKSDKAALAEEVKAANLAEPRPAPSGADFKLRATPSWFGTDEARNLAAAVISYQTPSGGWSKHLDFTKGPRERGMHWSSQSATGSWHYVGTFDNRSTTEQLRLLAGMFGATKRNEFKTSFLKGLDYIFDAQFPNGGWPQVYPLEGGYHDHITFNDNAIVHILELLDDIARNEPSFSFVDDAIRNRAAVARDAGIRCILKAQVTQNGRKTVWCAQHEPLTLSPAPARRIEPASLSGGESVGIVRFLMKIPNPPPSIISAIQDSTDWFEHSRITKLPETKRADQNQPKADRRADEAYWARFYEVESNKPIFPGGQTGRIYETFETMAAENRVGYDFYVSSPATLLAKDLPAWRKKNSRP